MRRHSEDWHFFGWVWRDVRRKRSRRLLSSIRTRAWLRCAWNPEGGGLAPLAGQQWRFTRPRPCVVYVASGLQLADGADRGKVTITANYLEILGHGYVSPSLTADLAVAGANGLDTGAEAANTWYAVHVIDSTAGGPIASLLSLSGTAPTLPSGYNNSRLVGWMRNNGSSNLYRILHTAGDSWVYWNEDLDTGTDFRVWT